MLLWRLFCCCCGWDEDGDNGDEGENTPLVRSPTRFRPKRLPPPSVGPGSPLPCCSANELVYFLSAYRMVGPSTAFAQDNDTFATVGAQKLLAGCSEDGIMVKDYMTPIKYVLKCGAGTKVLDAVSIMVAQNVSLLLVVDKKQPVGLLTMKGILRKVILQGKPATTAVREVMLQELHMVPPEASHSEAVDLLHYRKTHCLVVMNASGQCLGVATSYDIARMDAELLQYTIQCSSVYNSEHCELDPTAIDLQDMYTTSFRKLRADYKMLLHQGSMSDLSDADVVLTRTAASQVTNFMRARDRTVTCGRTTPVAEIAALIAEQHTDAVVVLSDDRRQPVGIVTLQELVPDYLSGVATLQSLAEDVMHTPVTALGDYSRNQATSLMHRKQVHHLVVTGPTGQFLGLCSSLDIARLDACTLKRSILRRGSLSAQSIGEETMSLPHSTSHSSMPDCGTIQIGTRVSLTLEATFLSDALAKD